MANNSREEPKTAPQSDCWYNLTLGSSFKDESSNKYCTLRYDFKPASIDKTKPGSLRKTKENRVSVEFHNNQIGKPKVTFGGSSEEYKENDAVLFFDGETFRLERLYRAVKQLRYSRIPGESAAASSASAVAQPGLPFESRSSPIKKAPKSVPLGRSTFQAMPVPVQVERIDICEPENAENPGAKFVGKATPDHPPDPRNISAASLGTKNEDVEEHQDIDIDDLFGSHTPENENESNPHDNNNDGFDVNVPHENDTDDEIADVDDSGDEVEKGPNAAEALRAQVNAEGRGNQSSSSSSSSGSGSSGSGSDSGSSSSSDSEGSDEVNSI